MTDQFSKETEQQRIYQAFETLITGEDGAIDLAQAALLIARSEYSNLDMADNLAQLDALARRVRAVLCLPDAVVLPQLPEEIDVLSVIDALNQVLFVEEQFCGNEQDYYNANNSFLNKVLETRMGIPISLSLIYIEVARRVGIQVDGVGLPQHFMVRCKLPQGMMYIDPYTNGTLMNEQGCREWVGRIVQQRRVNPRWFEPVTQRQILVRMLNNLKNIYIETEDYRRMLTICNFILLLTPYSAREYKDRGLLHLQLKHYSRAIKDFTVYLEFAPEADDRYEIRNYIKTARQMIAQMN